MKILLCDIPLAQENKFGAFKKVSSKFPPINLLYLGTILKRNNHTVKITTEDYSMEKVRLIIKEFEPDIIGVTFMTLAYPYLGEFLDMAGEASAGAILIAGGYHSSLVPVEVMQKHPKLHAVFVGESENSVVKFASSCEGGFPTPDVLREIPGIYFRDEVGKVSLSSEPEILHNLDDLPFPDLDLIDNYFETYHGAINRHFLKTPQVLLLTGRGCPYSCHFCGRFMYGRKVVRQNSVPYRIEMIKFYKKRYGIKSIIYGDEFLTLSLKDSTEFCEALHANGLTDIKWVCSGHVNNMSYEFAKMLKNAGCLQIGFGCESGSQRVLEIINKKVKVEKMSKAIQDCSRAGLSVFGNFILGCPGETTETIEETRKFILENPLSFIVFCFFTPFPGSHFGDMKNLDKYGTLVDDDITKFNTFSGIPFVPNGLSKQVLSDSRDKIYRDFYLRFPRIFKELKYATNLASWKFFLRAIG